MLFFIVILAALALWAVIVAVLAVVHDGPGPRLGAGEEQGTLEGQSRSRG